MIDPENLDEPRRIMYEELREEFGPLVDGQLEAAVNDRLTKLWDRRGQIRRQLEDES